MSRISWYNKHSQKSSICIATGDHGNHETPPPTSPMTSPRYFVALFDYDPTSSSPNRDVDNELAFSENDVIKVSSSLDVDGFYQVGGIF